MVALRTIPRATDARLRGYPLATVRDADGGAEVLGTHRKVAAARRFLATLRALRPERAAGAYVARVVD